MKLSLTSYFDLERAYPLKLLHLVANWLDSIRIDNSIVAGVVCYLVPATCPFARDVKLFRHTLFHIPPLCKFNPLYEHLLNLRFRALCYLESEEKL